jgi:hypothetical protein
MWTLTKKNSFVILLLAVPLMALLSVYMLTVRKSLTFGMLIFLGQMLMYCVLVSVLISEKAEEKNNGYHFMSHLPIKDRDIVASKFVVILTTTALLCAYSFALVSFMDADANLFPFGRVLLLFCGNLSLVLGACFYILVFRWGYSTFMKISVIAVIALMVGPFLFLEFVLARQNIDNGSFLQYINDLPWLVWLCTTAITLALFWGLFKTALRAKENQRGQ